ncbi:MAG: hypothetical protein IJ088_11375, partial [Clostridia bacterium]|nr:hypothetical protein [Clostridia bacterium]
DKLPEVSVFFVIRQLIILAEKQKGTDHEINRDGQPDPRMHSMNVGFSKGIRVDKQHHTRDEELE